MKVWLDSCGVGTSQACECPAPWFGVAADRGRWVGALGGWKTTMSPTLGWSISRLVSTRWPMCSVGTIEPLGIR